MKPNMNLVARKTFMNDNNDFIMDDGKNMLKKNTSGAVSPELPSLMLEVVTGRDIQSNLHEIVNLNL